MILTKPLSKKCHIRTCGYKTYHFPNEQPTNSTFDTVHKSAGLNVMTPIACEYKNVSSKKPDESKYGDKVDSREKKNIE